MVHDVITDSWDITSVNPQINPGWFIKGLVYWTPKWWRICYFNIPNSSSSGHFTLVGSPGGTQSFTVEPLPSTGPKIHGIRYLFFWAARQVLPPKHWACPKKKSMGRHRPWTQTWHCYELIGWKSGSPSRVPEKVWPLKRDIQMLRKFSLKEASWIMLPHLLYISLEHIL